MLNDFTWLVDQLSAFLCNGLSLEIKWFLKQAVKNEENVSYSLNVGSSPPFFSSCILSSLKYIAANGEIQGWTEIFHHLIFALTCQLLNRNIYVRIRYLLILTALGLPKPIVFQKTEIGGLKKNFY